MSTKQHARLKRASAALIAVVMFMSVFAVISLTDNNTVYATGEKAQVTASQLTVRSGAGTKYSSIGSLKKGYTFTVKGSKNDSSGVKWYKLTYNSKTGYVSSKYVNIKKTTSTSTTKKTGKVNTSSGALTVRKGAGTNYASLGTIAKGKTFTIKGTKKDKSGTTWYAFNFNGKTGYVSSKYVKLVSSASKTSSSSSVTGKKGKVSTSSGSLTVRSGAGSSYKSIGSLAKGKTFTIKGSKKDKSGTTWYKLSYNGKTGYVSSKYVKITSSSSSVTGKKGKVSTSSGSLTVRSGAGKSYKSIGSLAKGKTFTIKGSKKDKSGTTWYKLSYNGKTGYVSSKYVKITSSSSSVTGKKGKVNTSSGPLTVRKGAGTSYKRLGSLAKGKTFTIKGTKKDKSGTTWYKLSYNGKTGYVSSKYVKIVSSSSSSSTKTSKAVTFKMGTVKASGGVNVRSGAGTSYKKLTTLDNGSTVKVTGSKNDKSGTKWYKCKYNATKTGYISSKYLTVKTVTSDSAFETEMTAQGFPSSYKDGLRMLHAKHPKWVFKASKMSYTWSTALSKESKLGVNLVSSSSPTSYRSKASGAYNSKTKTYTKFDGSWYAASKTVIAYYMDPRNFLTEDGIYQFMKQTYDSKSQNSTTVKAVIKGSFMAGKNPGGGYSSYQSLINAAGKKAGVSPNVLAAMIIQEQGWNGSSLVSGTYSGYKGYYNFFNIGAYATSSMNAVQRGLWYAKQSGSYSRPWNTPYKSILGGAQFYAQNYVNNKQDSYYTKKFNVRNGSSNVGSHQYMTNVAGAASEGSIVKRAYSSNSNYPVVFQIPVYKSMPSSACQLP